MKPGSGLLYITCLEDIGGGIIRTQSLGLLKGLRCRSGLVPDPCVMLSFVQLHVYWRRRREVENLRADLLADGIHLIVVPTLFLNRWLKWGTTAFAWTHLPTMLWAMWRWQPGVLHGRSYAATLLAHLARRFRPVKVIFDMRGIFPYEAELLGYWRVDSKAFKRWRKIEARLVHESDVVITVSEEHALYAKESDPAATPIVIHCWMDSFRQAPAQPRSDLRVALSLPVNRPIFVYSGSLGPWTKVGHLSLVFRTIRTIEPGAFLLILTEQACSTTRQFTADGHSNADYTVRRLKPQEVYGHLAAADIALLPRTPHRVNEVSFPVKLGEYLACGLPVLLEAHVKGAARFVQDHAVGIAVDFADRVSLKAAICKLLGDQDITARCRSVARNELSRFEGTAKYAAIYAKLLGGTEVA